MWREIIRETIKIRHHATTRIASKNIYIRFVVRSTYNREKVLVRVNLHIQPVFKIKCDRWESIINTAIEGGIAKEYITHLSVNL